MKRFALRFAVLILALAASVFVYKQVTTQKFALYNVLDHYGWTTSEQKQALQDLMQKAGILKEGETFKVHYPERETKEELLGDIVDLIDQTQEHFFRRGNDLERWEVTTGKWMSEDIPGLQKRLNTLGMIAEVKPLNKTPDALCILGSTYKNMITRLTYAAKLVAEDHLLPRTLILIGAERYATVGVDGTEDELKAIAAEFEMDDYKQLTETNLMIKAYQDSPLFEKFPLEIIDTPRGEEKRPTTPMTIRELSSFLIKRPELQSLVFISSQPYVKYQEGMIKAVLGNVGCDVTFEVVGNAVEQPEVTRPLIEGVGSHIYTRSPDLIASLGIAKMDDKILAALDRHYQKNPELYTRLNIEDEDASIIDSVATAYIDFISALSSWDGEPVFNELFAENVTKIENGKVLLTNLKGLQDQLKNMHKMASPWAIELLDTVNDIDQKASVVRFKWSSENLGHHTTMAILRLNDEGKIVEINEVYNKYAS